MKRSLIITATSDRPGGWILAPRPFDHWGQRFVGFDAAGVSEMREIRAENSECRGYLLRAERSQTRLVYHFEQGAPHDPAFAAPEWVWRPQANRYTNAAPSLLDRARERVAGAPTERAALERIVEDAAELFAYDHPETKFNDGHETVPTVCGTTKGSCVDINTYILAAARAVGLTGQYIAGYWIHPQKTETRDMHCWLAFAPDGDLVFWDLAHVLKWGAALDVEIGAETGRGLNPVGGRRLAMSCGRGLEFETPVGRVAVSHFSEPVLLEAGGALTRPELLIEVEEPSDCRTQLPSDLVAKTAAE